VGRATKEGGQDLDSSKAIADVGVVATHSDDEFGAPFSKMMTEQDNGRFVNVVVPSLWNWNKPTRRYSTSSHS
jgi:hypothetical protein